MNWQSAADFFAMGGYGLYVWGSFGICALAFAVEFFFLSQRGNAIVRSLRQRVLAEQMGPPG